MRNISENKLDKLSQEITSFFDLLNRLVSWVDTNLNHEEKDKLNLHIKDRRRVVRKIQNSLKSKPVFALFGASQVGKSYLIKIF